MKSAHIILFLMLTIYPAAGQKRIFETNIFLMNLNKIVENKTPPFTKEEEITKGEFEKKYETCNSIPKTVRDNPLNKFSKKIFSDDTLFTLYNYTDSSIAGTYDGIFFHQELKNSDLRELFKQLQENGYEIIGVPKTKINSPWAQNFRKYFDLLVIIDGVYNGHSIRIFLSNCPKQSRNNFFDSLYRRIDNKGLSKF